MPANDFGWVWALDGWIIATGVLCAAAAALLGNFLVLRRLSLLGDAISHAVLPGLAAAFFLTGSRNSLPMFVGAVLVGVLTAFLTEWIRGIGKVDEGAAMGVVFTSLFALGLVLIVRAADHVDLDPGCVLYGAIEMTPLDTTPLAGIEVPRATIMLGIVAAIDAAFLLLFFKELKVSSFDPELSTSLGIDARWMHYLLMTLVAVTAVASFESVGNILVVAMFVVPPAAAYLLTDRLGVMIAWSVVIAAIAAAGGHFAAVTVPTWFGLRSTTTAGMMATVAGGLFLLAAAFGPRHGVVVRFVRHRVLAWQILEDDVLALLYRIEENGPDDAPRRDRRVPAPTAKELRPLLLSDPLSLRLVLARLRWLGQIDQIAPKHAAEPATPTGLALTPTGLALTLTGRSRAQNLVRSHRLWEEYLTSRAGLDTGRIHDKAERFEHFTDPRLRERLDKETDAPRIDPHGKPIPTENPDQP